MEVNLSSKRWANDRQVTHAKSPQPDLRRKLSIVTYNTLADCYIPQADMYPHTELKFLFRDGISSRRHHLLTEEIRWLNADIFCLQELDDWYYNGIIDKFMDSLGYSGVYMKKADPKLDGLAIFYRRSKFKKAKTDMVLLSDFIDKLTGDKKMTGYKTGHVLLMVALESLEDGSILAIGNTHSLCHLGKHVITTTAQILCAAQAMLKFVQSLQSTTDDRVPYVLCGDFNIEPQYPIYNLLEEGTLNKDTLRQLDYIVPDPTFTVEDKLCKEEEKLLSLIEEHLTSSPLKVKSAYNRVLDKESGYTSYCLGQGSVLDYIWLSADIEPVSVLEVPKPDSINPHGAIPSNTYPSDHFSLKAELVY
ncbi:carbon catabolite repressor protein 4 homolog 4 [Nematostella vectensis]|uniref:carbon catabolite repressor protein 4 homolog 4 n=1 Tax=Nematostella vectensis TaxID=45351 RepID=UPI00207772FC|nr:carbon catabolite repressor protein 4 homolog 4 [Nematostella vectensis]